VACDGREEAVDVDRAEAAGEGDLLLRCDLLVAEEDHAVVVEGLADLGEMRLVHRLGEVHSEHLGAQRAGDGGDLDAAVAHGKLLRRG
jgi:hypothetical protein